MLEQRDGVGTTTFIDRLKKHIIKSKTISNQFSIIKKGYMLMVLFIIKLVSINDTIRVMILFSSS